MAAAVQEGQDQDDHVEADAVRTGGMARANPTIGEDLRIRKGIGQIVVEEEAPSTGAARERWL